MPMLHFGVKIASPMDLFVDNAYICNIDRTIPGTAAMS